MQPTIIHDIVDSAGNVIQRFNPRLRWDITTDPLIKDFRCENSECTATGAMKTVSLSAVQNVQAGMRLAAPIPVARSTTISPS